MDLIDRKIVMAMQEDFPLVAEPYKELAGRVGVSEEELLIRLQKQKQSKKKQVQERFSFHPEARSSTRRNW